jgi:hypothetical protein
MAALSPLALLTTLIQVVLAVCCTLTCCTAPSSDPHATDDVLEQLLTPHGIRSLPTVSQLLNDPFFKDIPLGQVDKGSFKVDGLLAYMPRVSYPIPP